MNGVKSCHFGSVLELGRVISLQEVDEVSTKLYRVLGSAIFHVVGKKCCSLLNVKGI